MSAVFLRHHMPLATRAPISLAPPLYTTRLVCLLCRTLFVNRSELSHFARGGLFQAPRAPYVITQQRVYNEKWRVYRDFHDALISCRQLRTELCNLLLFVNLLCIQFKRCHPESFCAKVRQATWGRIWGGAAT